MADLTNRKPETWIVCGSRYGFRGVDVGLSNLMQRRGAPGLIRHGACIGVDWQADWWAVRKGIRSCAHPPDWQKHGRAAGPIRNRQMLDAGADLVVAFPGGRGTADMVKQARARGVEVVMLGSEEDEA